MQRSSLALLALAFALTAPTLARAQGNNAPMSYEAVMAAPLGSWAEYKTTIKQGNIEAKMRYLLLERNAKHIVMEMDGQTPMGAMVLRIEYEPAGADAWKLSKAMISMGDKPPETLPLPPGAATMLRKGDAVGEPVGKGSVTVPGGTFACEEFKKALPQPPMTFHVWMSPKVLPVGLVKQADEAGNMSTVLVSTGTGGKSKMPKPGAVAPGDGAPKSGAKGGEPAPKAVTK